tara:strand:+ start:6967 stop:8856 length:1890 start_codon:yes stop_codon:yes gene_type:complete
MKAMKIKDVFHSIKNGANIKQDKSSGGIPITRIETIVDNKFDIKRLGYSGIDDETYSNYYLKEGDILMSHINSISHLGKVAIFENSEDKIIHGMNLLCLKANENIILPKYAYYFFRSPFFIFSLIKITKKSINQASFNISNLEKIKIKIPEKLEDQIRITVILNKAEKLIQQRKKSINVLDEFLKSTFLNMFGDPFRNQKKFAKGIIRDVVSEVKYGTSKSSSDRGLYPYLRMNNITTNGYMDYSNLKYIDLNDSEIDKYIVQKGDLIFNRTNSKELVGKTGVFNEDTKMFIAGYLIRVRTNEKANSRYLWGFLNSVYGKQTLYGMCKSIVGMANINAQEFQNIKILIPPIDLQNKFGDIFEKTQLLKTQFETSLIELENLFSSLSQKAFKGELDLSTLRVLVQEEEYQNYVNDRTEPNHFPEPKIKVEFPEKSIQSVVTPQMQEFIKSTNALSKIMPKTSASIKLPSIFEKISQQIDQINRMVAPFEKLPKIPESVAQAMKTFENIKSISSTLKTEKKSARVDAGGLGNLTGIIFNEIEGLAVIEEEFSKKRGGFTFQDFEKFLKKEKFKYTYKELQQFIFKQIEEKKLIQHFWSNDRTNRLQQELEGEKAILYLDESIWFVCNNTKL